jgi:hypothetical protein
MLVKLSYKLGTLKKRHFLNSLRVMHQFQYFFLGVTGFINSIIGHEKQLKGKE